MSFAGLSDVHSVVITDCPLLTKLDLAEVTVAVQFQLERTGVTNFTSVSNVVLAGLLALTSGPEDAEFSLAFAGADSVSLSGGGTHFVVKLPYMNTAQEFLIQGNVTAVELPRLTSLDGYLMIENCSLSSFSAPLLVTASDIIIDNNFALSEVELPSLEIVDGTFTASQNPLLNSFDFPALTSVNQDYATDPVNYFLNCTFIGNFSR